MTFGDAYRYVNDRGEVDLQGVLLATGAAEHLSEKLTAARFRVKSHRRESKDRAKAQTGMIKSSSPLNGRLISDTSCR